MTYIKIIGLLDSKNDELSKSMGGLLLTDISTAQELLDKIGFLSQIDLLIDEDTPLGIQELELIRDYLPSGVER